MAHVVNAGVHRFALSALFIDHSFLPKHNLVGEVKE